MVVGGGGAAVAQAAGVGGGIGGHLSLLSPRVTPHSRRGSALSSKSVSRAGSLSRTSGADTAATVAGLGEAVAFLQGEIDDAVMARGAVHARSWKYPTACAAEIDIHSILERYAFVGSDPRHAMVARLSLLELIVDRMVLLAETTTGHSAVCAAGAGGASSPAADGCTLCDDPSAPAAGSAEQAAGAVENGGVTAVGTLCKQVKEMREQIERLQLLLDSKDAQLERRDAELARLSAPNPSASAVVEVSVACTQTDPESEATPRCTGCAKLLAATATVNDEINALGLVDRASVASPGLSPFQCTDRCEKFLLSSAAHLHRLGKEKEGWLADRDSAREAHRAAAADAAAQSTRADAAEATLESARKANRAALDTAEATLAAEVARLEAAVETARESAEATAAADARATALAHAESLQEAREAAATQAARLTQQLHQASELNASATASLTAARAAASTAEASLATLTADLEASRAESAALKEQLTSVEATAAAEGEVADRVRRESAAVVETERQTRTAAEQAAAAKIAALESARDAAAAEASETAARAEAAEAEARRAETQRAGLATEIAQLRGEVDECRSIAEEAVKARADAEAWLDKAGAERRRLLQKIAKLNRAGMPSARSDVSSATSADSRRGSNDSGVRRSSDLSRSDTRSPIDGRDGQGGSGLSSTSPPALVPHPPTGPPIALARGRRSSPTLTQRTVTVGGGAQQIQVVAAKGDRQAAIRKYLAARAQAGQSN